MWHASYGLFDLQKEIYPVIYGVVQGQEQCTEVGEDFGGTVKDKALKSQELRK